VPSGHPSYSRNSLENYAFVNAFVTQAVRKFLGDKAFPILLSSELKPADKHCGQFCMAKPTRNDVMLDGRKVGGGAQRNTKQGYLHQGTISISFPEESFLAAVLKPETCVLDSMRMNTYPLLESPVSCSQLEQARTALQDLLIAVIKN